MSGKVINLRTARKQRARSEQVAAAALSAARHGVSKAERTLRDTAAEKAARDLDGKKRE